MWIIQSNYNNQDEYFQTLERELLSLIDGEKNLTANLANIASWIFHSFPLLNWSGFYLWSSVDQELILGPFQGMPACIRIKPGKGVCGTSFKSASALRVDDVSLFPNHIACDSASNSELVIPLIKNGIVMGVLDLDSPNKARFTQQDEIELTKIFNKISTILF